MQNPLIPVRQAFLNNLAAYMNQNQRQMTPQEIMALQMQQQGINPNAIASNGLPLSTYDTPTRYSQMTPEQQAYAQQFWRLQGLEGNPTIEQLRYNAELQGNSIPSNFDARMINNELRRRDLLAPKNQGQQQ